MKLLKVTKSNPAYLSAFYAGRSGLASKSYAEQKEALDYDAYGWADSWSHALALHGYDVMEITYDIEPMQRAWAKEHSIAGWETIDLRQIAIIQAKNYQPDILWFNDYDEKLLIEIKTVIHKLKLTLGWVGSAISPSNHWKHIDLVLSCAQESVERMRHEGRQAEQLHHGFDPRIINRLDHNHPKYTFTFIGQLFRYRQFHLFREQLLLSLSKFIEITIFSSSARLGVAANARCATTAIIYKLLCVLKLSGVSTDFIKSLPRIGTLVDSSPPPFLAVHPKLRRYLQPDIYGLAMYNILYNSHISLNIHADSSPHFASNMRLFETTGVGTCLLTDWRENLPSLFKPDCEVVTYRSLNECVEKVRWLLDNPLKREEIAKAGQQRVLKDHTFAKRSEQFDNIVRKRIHL